MALADRINSKNTKRISYENIGKPAGSHNFITRIVYETRDIVYIPTGVTYTPIQYVKLLRAYFKQFNDTVVIRVEDEGMEHSPSGSFAFEFRTGHAGYAEEILFNMEGRTADCMIMDKMISEGEDTSEFAEAYRRKWHNID